MRDRSLICQSILIDISMQVYVWADRSSIWLINRRDLAVSELIRVSKPGAPIFVSVMSRLSVMVVELMLFQHEIGADIHREIRNSGNIDGTTGFTACHFFLPEELRKDFKLPSLQILELAGTEGLGSNHIQKINALARNKVRWQAWLTTHNKTRTPPVRGWDERAYIDHGSKITIKLPAFALLVFNFNSP